MKSILLSALSVAVLSLSVNSNAADIPAAAKTYNCMGCHAIEKKVVGPSWNDVAKKYKGDAGARANLIVKMIKGGKGVWGPMPMPASPKMTEQESAVLVDFVLGL